MTDFPPFTFDAMTGYTVNPTVFCSTGVMSEPTGSPNVRGVEFRLPRFKQAPVVSVQVSASIGSAMLSVYATKVNDNVAGQTQVAIEAATVSGGQAAGDYYCTIIVTGMVL